MPGLDGGAGDILGDWQDVVIMDMERETLEYDVLIIGAGPAGLAAAVRLGQLALEAGKAPSICVLEKGAAVGSHILSGAVIDPVGLDALLPDWRQRNGFSFVEVSEERHLILDEDTATAIPRALIPPQLRQRGGIVTSLGDVCHWLGQEAETLGVDIVAGFAAVEPIVDAGVLVGVLTGDMGRDRQGQPRANFSPGAAIRARYTLVAEGARGSLTGQLETLFALRADGSTQKYALGLKELWRLDPAKHEAGLVIHSAGWPLGKEAHGGAFLYHLPQGLAAVGLVVHLDYRNPWLDPFAEFQRAKSHPALNEFLHGGERLGFGARTLACGGPQAVPDLIFPGGALIGCAAGLLDPARGKGVHGAILSGIDAAEATFAACMTGRSGDELNEYPQVLGESALWADLQAARNFKPWLTRFGTGWGGAMAGAELWLAQLGMGIPWTFAGAAPDHIGLRSRGESVVPNYPKPDGLYRFDRTSSLYLAGISHEENQPCHLHLHDQQVPLQVNIPRFAAPETRYCPAGVYEIVGSKDEPDLLMHSANCLHCKACDIKDPQLNIVWTPPEGGSGPNYRGM
ncbi:MAG: electron transfer flavoprotein-ubiquinone oxidoreductase [Formivibrio sp.]|nr:electron transfer flavoprotein-ubiquinone oxidoreductase [Formivibrio sp.]